MNIKKSLCLLSQFFLVVLLWNTPAFPQESQILKWGFGVRGGIGILTQDMLQGSSKGDPGPAISGEIFSFVNNYLTVGLNIEWDSHKVTQGSVERGKASTISFLPFYEIRVPYWGDFSPYQVLGVGLNFNSFKESSAFQAACPGCEFDPVNTMALKVGGGIDYFLTPTWALNTEIGWKYNSGEASIRSSGMIIAIEDYDANVLSVMVGIRKYF